ncbi:MAG: hypothetical protein F6K40_24075 [Okeania sp. SIO3I5]|uniref:hypothetical protein n=1 Tax=Okeania sp. SIO3I5 TaxID=2607805 RepID=UPI0013BB3045|nr:hypothetical protein [Okeania sp. SIO3I5]NEQ39163.1 hypothetical protein [Okeania sp. SIO3I5]
MDIEDIKNDHPIGTKVFIETVSGKEFYGTLVGIRKSSVLLYLPDDRKKSINVASIESIEEQTTDSLIQETDLEKNSSTPSLSLTESETFIPTPSTESEENSPTPSPPVTESETFIPTPSTESEENVSNKHNYSIEVINKVEEINASFKEEILQVKLEPLPPKLSLPSNLSSLSKKNKRKFQKERKFQREWIRLEEEYNRAKTNNEFQPLKSIISGYERIISDYPKLSSAARFNIGCLYLELNQFDDAKKIFEGERAGSFRPEGFYNLAVYALDKEEIDKAQCLYSLQEFFKQALLVDHRPAWYKCLELAIDLRKVDVLLFLLKQKLQKKKNYDVPLILDSFVFYLKENQQDDYANKLTQIILENSEDFKIAVEEIELIISELLDEPVPPPVSFPATTLSSFLKFYLENCDYVGVEAAKKQSKIFTLKDVEQLVMYADKVLGTKRLRERASYYLSAAKVLIDLGSEAEEKQRPRVHLRNFCSVMGDACIAEKQDNDIVRSYYAEAFLIAQKSQWVSQLDSKLSQYIMLFYYSSSDELLKPKLPTIESCLKEAISMNLGKLVIEGLLYLSWLNHEVGRVLINKIHLDRNLRELVQNLCYEILGEKGRTSTDRNTFVKLWGRGQELMGRQHQEIVDELAALDSLANNLDDLPEQIKKIQELREKFRLELDKKRLDKIKKIVTEMHNYSQQQSYTEQERYRVIINNNITQLTQEIEQSPTQDSWKFLFPYLSSLEITINQHFQKIQQAAEPESLKTKPSTYLPDTEDLDCQITIYNESGKSPASGIKIEVLESPTQEYEPKEKSISIMKALPGGESITRQIPVKITKIAQEAKVFTLHYELSYTTRAGRHITRKHKESIQLYSAKDFQEINNPYGSYAQGNIVRDEKMFYGRDQLINNLISSIRNPNSAKNFLIYGQKRTGKSSILYHLEQKLKPQIIPVRFSIGGMNNFSDATFLYIIIKEIAKAFDELTEEGYPSIDVQRPDLEKFQDYPKIIFEDYMSKLGKNLRKRDKYCNTIIMLLIDEFSYIYGEIQKGNVPSSFMQSWKALLEENYFGIVLVGQDYMPLFIKRFPNEFSIMESQRISYLEKDSARNLIIDPIRTKEGKSRYTEEAVNKLIDLTAGSPFYIQIFCNRLVNYMNRKKIMYVTDADIERVKEGLITGNNSLNSAAFDNLTSAGDEHTDKISKEDAEAVLLDIAKETRLQPYCNRSSITTETSKSSISIDEVLKDLETREVIEKQGTSGYRIKVGLFKEWLLVHQ